MRPIQTSMYAVYLLHFDKPVGKAMHYVGVTKAARLHWRQLEHARGVGASLTARAARDGVGWHVAAVWWVPDPSREKEIKKAGHFEKSCPICVASKNCCIQPVGLAHYQPKVLESEFKGLNVETAANVSRYQK